MPKELTHWHVAHRVLHSVPPGRIRDIIAGYPHHYYLGAIAHDIPFYDLSQPKETSIERLGEQLHGVNGENTLVPVSNMMEQALTQADRQSLLSFLLGMLTHYIADSSFHPLVYYLTGNYYDSDENSQAKAVFRHRLLETAIDLWLETEEPLDYPRNLAALWRRVGPSGAPSLALIVDQYQVNGDHSTAAHFRTAWRTHRFLQAAFKRSVPWRILSFYRRFGHPKVEKHEALFYPQPLDLSMLNAAINWQHPVTGIAGHTTLGELYTESNDRAVELFNRLAEHPISKWPLILQRLEPLSLDSGLPYVPVAAMKYFLNEPIEYKLRIEHKKEI